jgi:hypothetical protein
LLSCWQCHSGSCSSRHRRRLLTTRLGNPGCTPQLLLGKGLNQPTLVVVIDRCGVELSRFFTFLPVGSPWGLSASTSEGMPYPPSRRQKNSGCLRLIPGLSCRRGNQQLIRQKNRQTPAGHRKTAARGQGTHLRPDGRIFLQVPGTELPQRIKTQKPGLRRASFILYIHLKDRQLFQKNL